jgi:hypothetical protein
MEKTMKLRFFEEASDEFSEAVKYYNDERPGLGFEFALEIKKSLSRIKKYPDSWPELTTEIRRCIVNRFPFAILFSNIDNIIFVIALMHMKRKPGYWKNRMKTKENTKLDIKF